MASDFQAKSNRSPTPGIAPIAVSIAMFATMRAKTGPGTPSRTASSRM